MCCLLLLFSSCTTSSTTKYQRISFENDTLGDKLTQFIDADTEVINKVTYSFPTQLPIYKIKERPISETEFKIMLEQLNISEDPAYPYDDVELDGNNVYLSLIDYVDYSRGYFDMTDEELEMIAWETFNKIPFLVGDYEYVGIQNKYTVTDSTGTHISRAGVGFCRLLDGVRVVGAENCVLYFDGSGLVEIHIRAFDYENIGTMDLVSLDDAASKIKAPDSFSLDAVYTEGLQKAETLHVDRVKLLQINQYYNGCTILQPIYNFIGTASFESGKQAECSSKIIAIPESYTYEAN